MEVRLTVKTTPGRPLRAILVMAALALLAGLLAWALTVYKRDRPVRLTDPVVLPALRVGVSVPADWTGVRTVDPTTGQVAMFYDPAFRPGDGRGLLVFGLEGRPVGAGDLFADFGGLRQVRERHSPDRTRLGPLPARQLVVTTVAPRRVRTHILRAAVLGHQSYLLLQLDCLGPPMPWEQRLMDRIAESVALDPAFYPEPSDLPEQVRIDLADRAGDWLVSRLADRSADLTLLPRADRADRPGFWGLVHLTSLTVGPEEDLAGRLAAELAGGNVPDVRFEGGGPLASAQAAVRLAEQAVQHRPLGPLGAWRFRAEDREAVRLAYIWRPVGPNGSAVSNRAFLLSGWAAVEDEPAATEAIEALARSSRLR